MRTRAHLRSCIYPTIAAGVLAINLLPDHAAPPSAQMRADAQVILQACRGDYDRLCANVQPGGGRILACLQSHSAQLSPTCADVMQRASALKNDAAAAGVLPK